MMRKQAVSNAKWIIVCKIIQSIMQLIIGMISARYLGPSNYGLITYAASIVAFALPIMRLGLNATLVYELVESPESEGEIMGTSLTLNVLSGIACIGGVSLFSVLTNMGERETIIVCILYSVSILFAALEMIQYWYQYKLLSKYSSIIMLVGYFCVSAYKIYLLASGKSVYWFALSHSVEYGIIGILLLWFYNRKSGYKLSFSWSLAKKLFSKSKHYIVSAMMIVIIQNTDHIMLTSMVGKTENGYYSAAATAAIVAQFVYLAVVDSYRPLILSAKKTSKVEYENNISGLYSVIVYFLLIQSVAFTIFAPLIINILYGAEYLAAVPVLRILMWYQAFAFMGTIRNIWILAEGKQKCLPFINFVGVVFNIVLNFFLIPVWGACGAAIASLATQFIMNFALGFVFKPIRYNNVLMLRGFNPKVFVGEIKSLLHEIKK